MTHPTKARRKNPRTGREGGGHTRPPQRTATSSPKVSRSQGRDEGAGSEATVPLTARRTGGHTMRSARGRAASRGRLANEGSAHKSQRRRSWGFFLRSAVDHVLGPRARDGTGPHDERWSALRGGTRRVFRDSGRRYAARAMEGHGWNCCCLSRGGSGSALHAGSVPPAGMRPASRGR